MSKPKTQHEMFEASFKRPRNYFELSSDEQWQIDEELGLLDWDGAGLTKAEEARFKAHYKKIEGNDGE